MLEKNSLVHPERRGRPRHHSARIDPHAELTSALINQAVSAQDDQEQGAPQTGFQNAVRSKNRTDGQG